MTPCPMALNVDDVRRVVAQALAEDVGPGDVTSESVLPPDAAGRAHIVSRAPGVIAGLPVAEEVFRQVSRELCFTALVDDGAKVREGTRVAEIHGPGSALLSAERTALNFLQRLSGIATVTRRCVDAVSAYDAQILDTRKTTPCLRLLEKYAVRIGGGMNHRIGLFDQVLIKDNHLRMAVPGSDDLSDAVRQTVRAARDKVGTNIEIEVEAETLEMVAAALDANADIIMLDNMSLDEMSQATEMVRRHRQDAGGERPYTEASGGMTEDRLAAVAATGVDRISLGAITHSAPILDLAMDVV